MVIGSRQEQKVCITIISLMSTSMDSLICLKGSLIPHTDLYTVQLIEKDFGADFLHFATSLFARELNFHLDSESFHSRMHVGHKPYSVDFAKIILILVANQKGIRWVN